MVICGYFLGLHVTDAQDMILLPFKTQIRRKCRRILVDNVSRSSVKIQFSAIVCNFYGENVILKANHRTQIFLISYYAFIMLCYTMLLRVGLFECNIGISRSKADILVLDFQTLEGMCFNTDFNLSAFKFQSISLFFKITVEFHRLLIFHFFLPDPVRSKRNLCADPDQLAPSEANCSGSTLFVKVGYVRVQQDKG